MKTLEIRRHSIRSQPGNHLNQTGVNIFNKKLLDTLQKDYLYKLVK